MGRRTKAEMEAVRAAVERAKSISALRWIDRDVPAMFEPPGFHVRDGGFISGFYVNQHGFVSGNPVIAWAIQEAWSKHGSHGVGASVPGQSASQRGISLHANRLNALIDLRQQVALEFGRRLATIDDAIQAEEKTARVASMQKGYSR